MDKAAAALLEKLQDQFETEYGVTLGYGSISESGPDNWVAPLNSQDGQISVEGAGETDVAAIEDAFAKARAQLAEQSAAPNQQPSKSKRPSNQAAPDSYAETSNSSPEQPPSRQRRPSETDDPVVEIEGLAGLDLSDGVRLILQRAAHITPANLITYRTRTAITTTMLLFAILDLARNLSQSKEPPQLEDAEAIMFLHRQLAGASFDTIRNNYFYPEAEQNDGSQRPQNVSGSQIGEPQPLSRVTTNVLNIVKFAAGVALETTGQNLIRVRHLIGGLLGYEAEARPSGIQRRLAELGLEGRQLRAQYFRLVQANFPNDNEKAWIVTLITRAAETGARLPQYVADDAKGETDLLGIDQDVNALAALISTHYTGPPLAIGIFGDWGSGKTFFMRRLQRRINWLSAKARANGAPQHKLSFFKNIIQIEFNAWHYVESNLWASMVEHIFANLRSPADKDDKLQTELLEKLKSESLFRDQAIAERELAENAVKKAKERLQEIKSEQEKKLGDVARQFSVNKALQDIELSPETRTQLTQLAEETRFAQANMTALDFYQAVQEARAVLSRGGAVLAPLVKAKDSGKRFGWLLAIILLSPFAAVFIDGVVNSLIKLIDPDIAFQFGNVFSWITTLLAGGAAWLRAQSQWVSKQVEHVEKANQALEAQLQKERDKFEQDISAAKLELSRLEAAYQVALQAQSEAEQRIQAIEAQLAAGPAQQLARFIEERTKTDDYRKHLGLLALIRRDFDTLSNYIHNLNLNLLTPPKNESTDEDNSEPVQAEAGQAPPDIGINRIVLYIDDLDRCPPHKVVQVLQAIHLLLAFPLFVVVVGVDSRWVSYALMQRYKGLLRGAAASTRADDTLDIRPEATPHDYLEKIFQIPLWLEPVDAAGTREMLAGLIPNVVPDAPEPPVPIRAKAAAESPPPSLAAPEDDTEPAALVNAQPQPDEPERFAEPVNASDNQPVSADPTIPPTPSETPDLNPASLEIRKLELNFMQELSPILGRSPRSIKRFINVYRLIKVGLDEADLALFFEAHANEVSDAQIVMFLLATLTGMPAASRLIFRMIEDVYEKSAPTAAAPKLIELIGALNEDTFPSIRADLERLTDWITDFQEDELANISISQLHKWVPRVSRYSFRIEQSRNLS